MDVSGSSETTTPRHGRVPYAFFMIAFWAMAALAVTFVEHGNGLSSPVQVTAWSLITVVIVSWAYDRLVSRGSGLTHAIIAGTVWLALSIATEIVVTRRLGSGWYSLLGDPEEGLLRMIRMIAWVVGPALFARGGSS